MSHILKEMLLGKTIKDILSLCVPEMSATLRGEEYICNKCYRFLVKLMLFIDSCLESTEKIGTGAVSLECKEEEEDEESAVDDNNKITETEESPTSKRGSKRKQDLSKFTKTEDGGELDETRKPTEPPKKRGRKRKYPIEAEAVDEELYVSRDVQRPTGFKCYGRKDVQKDQAAAANAQDTNQGNAEEDVVSNTFTTVNIVRVCPPAPVETKEIDLVTPDDHSNVILIDHNYVPESTEYLMRCSSCLTDYRTLRGIKSHLTQSHGIQEEYQTVCSLCNMKFIRYKDLLKHRKSHGHPCDLCEQVFDVSDKLDAHVQSHVEKFCCVRCGAKFKKEEQLNKHVPLHAMMSKIRELFAKMEKPELECSQCPLKFVNASKLQQHNNVVHLKIKPFKCEECGKEYTTKATLNTHFRVNHSSNILLPYQCGECGTSFRKKESLERHHEVVHPPSAAFQNPNLKTYSKFNAQEREYQCIFCAFKTKEKQELIDHLSVHADRRKYFECSYCRLKLSCERTKTIHERSHEDPLNQHVCSTCWKRFSTEEDLKEHEEHHNMVSKKFSCSLCSQTFNRQLQLENHILDVHVQTLQTEIDKSKLELIEQNKRAVAMDWSTDEEEEDMLDEEEEEEETETSMLSTEVTPETEMRGKVIKSLIENDTFEATDNEDEEVIELGEEELETVEDADEIYVRNIIKRQKGGQIETENTQKREAKSATQEGKPAVPEEVKSDIENKVKREDNKPKTMKVEIY